MKLLLLPLLIGAPTGIALGMNGFLPNTLMFWCVMIPVATIIAVLSAK